MTRLHDKKTENSECDDPMAIVTQIPDLLPEYRFCNYQANLCGYWIPGILIFRLVLYPAGRHNARESPRRARTTHMQQRMIVHIISAETISDVVFHFIVC